MFIRGLPQSITARYFSAYPSDSTSRRTPLSSEARRSVAQVHLACFRLSPLCLKRLLHTFHFLRPATYYRRFWIQRPSSERRRDFNPPDSCAAQRTLRTQPPPSRLRPTSQFRRLYGLPCSSDFSLGRGGLLQLLSMSSSPCCRFHPAEVSSRIGQISAVHVAFALRLQARPSGTFTFEATTRSLLLRPGDSWPPLGRPRR